MTRVTPASYSHYGPLRYEITRPFAKKFAKTAVSIIAAHGREKTNDLYHRILWQELGKNVEINVDKIGFATNEARYIDAYSDFYAGGRVIFDFSSELTSALLSTDANKIPLKTINFPYNSFYIHFGEISWPEGFPENIEGVYVSKFTDANLNVYIQFQPLHVKQFTLPFYMESHFGIDGSNFTIPLNDEVVNLEEFVLEEESEFREIMDDVMSSPHGDEIADLFGYKSLSAVNNGAVAKAVINCLLYLSAVPSDVEETWDDRAPRDVVERALKGEKEGTRKSAERTLVNQDYLKVKLIGKKFIHAIPHQHRESSKQITHIRRGHFRNQAYGHEWSEHRVIFIPPVLINPDSDEIPGRIYQT
jgi:hypothetical protein